MVYEQKWVQGRAPWGWGSVCLLGTKVPTVEWSAVLDCLADQTRGSFLEWKIPGVVGRHLGKSPY